MILMMLTYLLSTPSLFTIIHHPKTHTHTHTHTKQQKRNFTSTQLTLLKGELNVNYFYSYNSTLPPYFFFSKYMQHATHIDILYRLQTQNRHYHLHSRNDYLTCKTTATICFQYDTHTLTYKGNEHSITQSECVWDTRIPYNPLLGGGGVCVRHYVLVVLKISWYWFVVSTCTQ